MKNNEFKKVDIVKVEDFDFYNNLVYDISYKILIGAKPLHIRFDKIDEFVRIYVGTRYLALFGFDSHFY